MKEYKVKMLDSLPADWSSVERVLLDETPWLTDYIPVTYGQVVFVRGDGFYCRMTCEERNPKAVFKNWMDYVCKDSCMEFFAAYDNTSPLYLNIEANSIGTVLAQMGTDRYDRIPADTYLGGPMTVEAHVGENEWTLLMHVSLEDLKKLYKMDTSVFKEGYSFRANLYKCGDETEVEHYNMWNRVETPTPDYHQLPYFGMMTLEA